MKTALLILSLIANAALAVVYVTKERGESPAIASEAAQLTKNKASADVAPATAVDAVGSAELSAKDVASLKTLWPLLNGGNLKAFVAELRARGFSPAMVRAMVKAAVYEQNKPKWRELQADDGGPFWKNPSYFSDPKRIAAFRDLSRAQSQQIKDLLGRNADDTAPSDLLASQLQRKYGDLAPEKVNRAEEVGRDYNDLVQDVYTSAISSSGGLQLVLLPEDREKLAYLDKQKREDLAKIMTPEELLNYDMRTSSTANQLRFQLMGFNPTPDEFAAIFKLQQSMDEKLGTTQFMSTDLYRKRQEALKDLQPEIDAALGPERAAAYKQATDPQYTQVNRLVARLELPPTASVEVVAVQKDIQQRATALRADQTLTPDQRTAQLSALVTEANGKISTALGGPRGLDAYKQYGGGWLQTLQARPVTRAGIK